MTNFTRLKQLQDEKGLIAREISSLDRQLQPILEKKKHQERLMSEVDKQINELGRKELIISDHAILRLLERRFGQEDVIKKAVDGLRSELEGRGIQGSCKIIIDGNLEAVINNNVLTTILER